MELANPHFRLSSYGETKDEFYKELRVIASIKLRGGSIFL
jgi:hypothetical protein